MTYLTPLLPQRIRNNLPLDLLFSSVYRFSISWYNSIKKEVDRLGTEKERKDTQKAVLYDLRRLLKNSGKDTYTVDELCNLLDTIADAKDQE